MSNPAAQDLLRFPAASDPRLRVLALLATYLVLGITVLGFNRSPLQILLVVSATCVLDMVFHRLLRGQWLFPLSAAITGLSLAILVNYSHGLWLPLIPPFFAVASKYLFTVNDRHVYNPSLFGLVLALWLSEEMISPAPAYQWGGYPAVAIFIVTAAILMFALKIRRTPLIVSFLAFYTINLAIRAWLTRWHVPPETLFFGTLSSPAFYLFAFFMITDPATSPKTARGQIAMSFGICAFDLALQQYGSFAAVFKAAFAVYSIMFIWRLAQSMRQSSESWLPRLNSALRSAAAVVVIAGSAAMVHAAVTDRQQSANADFYLTRIPVETSGLDAKPSDIMNQVDPRIAHVGKWLMSIGDAVAVADVNNDGALDVFLTYPLKDRDSRASLYLNAGDFKFVRHPIPALDDFLDKPKQQGLPSGALFLDYDNDGDQDLLFQVSYGHSRLLQNRLVEDGAVAFTDTGVRSRLYPYTVSQAAIALDVNRDGLLDVLVGNSIDPFLADYDMPTRFNIFDLPEPEYEGDRRMFNIMHRTWHDADNGGENHLFLNRGGTFEKVDNGAWGLKGRRWTIAIGAADLDDDGWTDLYLANDFGPDQLYLNRQGESFEEIRGNLVGELGRDTYKGMNASIADIDGNGYPDVYVSNVHHVLQPEGSLLWLNDGTLGTRGADAMDDRAVALNALNEHRFGWGAAVGDLDRDGRIDILQANGMVDDSYDEQYEGCPDFWYWNEKIALTPPDVHGYADRWADLRGRCIFPDELDRVYLNLGDAFVDVAADVGWNEGRNSRGIALADFDNDGDLDVLVTHQFDPAALYRNDGPAKSWIGLELVGDATTCNRDAVGTRVWVDFPGAPGMPVQYREVASANGFSAQGDRRLLLGLGDYDGPVSIDVQWCGTGHERFDELSINRYHRLMQRIPVP
jgi:Na+-translocating ferredoxin:NAD+ oxidoreductase RnfD subunit